MVDKLKFKQDLCAACFVTLLLTNFFFQALEYFGFCSRPIFLPTLLGILGIIGFLLLRSLAVNAAGEIFATGQACLELYYCVVLTYLQGLARNEIVVNASIYALCIAFCLLGLYLWSVLLVNNKFTPADMKWIIFLPMNYLLNISIYWDLIDEIGWTRPLFDGYADGNPFFLPLRWILLPALLIGYWRLAHSRAFGGVEVDDAFSVLTPFNRYFGIYFLAAAIILVLY